MTGTKQQLFQRSCNAGVEAVVHSEVGRTVDLLNSICFFRSKKNPPERTNETQTGLDNETDVGAQEKSAPQLLNAVQP